MKRQNAAGLGTGNMTVKPHFDRDINKLRMESLAELVRTAGKVNLQLPKPLSYWTKDQY